MVKDSFIETGIESTSVMVNYMKYIGSHVDFWKSLNLNPKLKRKELYNRKYFKLFLPYSDFISTTMKSLNKLDYLATVLRYKSINDVLVNDFVQIKSGQKQVVILGSGLDTRSSVYKNFDLNWFEIDSKEILEFKKKILDKDSHNDNTVYIDADYTKDDLIQKLLDNGISLKNPTYFIWEGNCAYIEQTIIEKIWNNIADNFTGYILLSMDYVTQDFIQGNTGNKEHNKMLDTVKNLGCPFVTGYNRLESFATKTPFEIKYNFSCDQLVEYYGVHDKPIPYLDYIYVGHLVRI